MKTSDHGFARPPFLWFILLASAFTVADVLLAQTTAPATVPPPGAAVAPSLTPLTAPPSAAPAPVPLTPAVPPPLDRRNAPDAPSIPPPAAPVKPPRARAPTTDPARSYQSRRSTNLPPNAANGAVPTLEDAIVTEETNTSPAAAAEKYRAIVATFDAQRTNAAEAVFRLGECLRKAGRVEEAKAQYGRILREFVDHPDLAQLSQKLLAEMPDTAGVRPNARPPIAGRENDEFLRKDMELVHDQISETQKLIDSGLATPSAIIPMKRELLRLEQQRADVANALQPKQLAQTEPTPARLGGKVSSWKEDLHAIEAELRQQRLELHKSNALRSLTLTNRPELLTPRLIADNRYQNLKEEYEQRLNATSSPNAGEEENKALEASRRKIARWMNEVYQPELDYSIKFAEQQVATLTEEAEKLKSMIAHENEESEARAHKRDEQVPGRVAY